MWKILGEEGLSRIVQEKSECSVKQVPVEKLSKPKNKSFLLRKYYKRKQKHFNWNIYIL